MAGLQRIDSVILGVFLVFVARDPTGVPVRAADKLPVPTAAAQDQALTLVKDVYGEECAKAASAEQKTAVVQKLLEAAKETEQGTANHYALLRVAWDVATQAGDAKLAVQITDMIGSVYEVNTQSAKLATVKRTHEFVRTSAQRTALATVALQLAEEASDCDDHNSAKELASFGVAVARKARDWELVKQIVAREKQILEAADAYAKAQVILSRLESEPINPEVNQAAGEYYCFVKGDWTKGITKLALGTDPAMKALAIKELRLSDSPAASELAELGDDWWDFGEKHDEAMKEKLRGRAGYWYRQALPGLNGLVKQKCEKRLEQVKENIVPSDEATVASAPDEKPSKKAPLAPVGTKQPAVAAAPRVDTAPVCAKLEARAAPDGLAPGTIAFTAPRGDGRVGANGFLMAAASGWERRGTAWACTYRRSESAEGVQFIHPFGTGHVVVTVSRNGLHVASPGAWTSRSYNPLQQTSLPLAQANNFAQVLNIEGEPPRGLVSILAPDGRYQFFLDGQLLAWSVVPFAVPMQLTPDFKGEGLPMTLPPGMGGVIIGPRDSGVNQATNITFGLLASRIR